MFLLLRGANVKYFAEYYAVQNILIGITTSSSFAQAATFFKRETRYYSSHIHERLFFLLVYF